MVIRKWNKNQIYQLNSKIQQTLIMMYLDIMDFWYNGQNLAVYSCEFLGVEALRRFST
jgi:hypothetical protein